MTLRHGLWICFLAALLMRVVLAFIYNPLDHMFSDPLRHWLNGERFMNPDIMGSSDPLMYQVWVYGLIHTIGADRIGIALVTGLLSAALPWFWYKALAELLPRHWALAGGIIVALMPSLIMIYGYFMNETLLLTLSAAATWLSLRALRVRTFGAFTWAALLWALASYTRSVALPMAAIFLLAIWLKPQPWKQRIAETVIVIICFGALALPACWHTSVKLHFCAPFGNTYLNEIYRASRERTIELNILGEGLWGFSSPSYGSTPLAPLSNWVTPRQGAIRITIDPTQGRATWKAELARIQAQPKLLTPQEDWAENMLYLFFGNSWPDNNIGYWLGWMAVANRWLWVPLIVGMISLAIIVSPRLRLKEALIPSVALMVLALLILQQQVPIEGRYRKPVEPLLIASIFIMLHALRRSPRAPEAV